MKSMVKLRYSGENYARNNGVSPGDWAVFGECSNTAFLIESYVNLDEVSYSRHGIEFYEDGTVCVLRRNGGTSVAFISSFFGAMKYKNVSCIFGKGDQHVR